MGINKFYKILNKYYHEVLSTNILKFKSDICYIDCTSRIYNLFYKYYKYDNLIQRINEGTDIYSVIDDIIEKLSNGLITQILENQYYKKYVLIFDYKFTSPLNGKFKFSDEIVKYFEKYDLINKYDETEQMSEIPMIPKNVNILNTPLDQLKLLVRNSSEIRWSYWNPNKNITDYVSINWLIDNIKKEFKLKFKSNIDSETQKTLENPVKKKYIQSLIITYSDNNVQYKNDLIVKYKKLLELKQFGFYRYLLERGIKRFATKKQNKSHDILNSLWYDTNNNEEFSSKFIEHYFEIQPQLIVNLVPHIVHKISDKINGSDKEVEFLGCEQESDFVIRKHIKINCPNNQFPTILTSDTDLLLLLSDVDCIIKMKLKIQNTSDDDINTNTTTNATENNSNNNEITVNKSNSPTIVLNGSSFTKKQRTYDTKTTLYINPKKFWEWLLNTNNYSYNELVSICCRLGTSYNCYKTKFQLENINDIREIYKTKNNIFKETLTSAKSELNIIFDTWYKKNKVINEKNLFGLVQLISAMELYKQADIIETEFHYIKPERLLNKSKIQFRYFDVFSELLLKSDEEIDLSDSSDYLSEHEMNTIIDEALNETLDELNENTSL